eukprot:3562008-Amphidinium_carterae.1
MDFKQGMAPVVEEALGNTGLKDAVIYASVDGVPWPGAGISSGKAYVAFRRPAGPFAASKVTKRGPGEMELWNLTDAASSSAPGASGVPVHISEGPNGETVKAIWLGYSGSNGLAATLAPGALPSAHLTVSPARSNLLKYVAEMTQYETSSLLHSALE